MVYQFLHNGAGRVIAGVSMGGHGALQLALNHPGLYGAAVRLFGSFTTARAGAGLRLRK